MEPTPPPETKSPPPPSPPMERERWPSLWEFLDKNQRPLSVLGVLSALTVLAKSLPLEVFGELLSFCFLSMAVVAWIELWGQFPAGEIDGVPPPWRIRWFRGFAYFAGVVLILYALLVFPVYVLVIFPFVAIATVREFLVPRTLNILRSDTFSRVAWGARGGPRSAAEGKMVRGLVLVVLAAAFVLGATWIQMRAGPFLEKKRSELYEKVERAGRAAREARERTATTISEPDGGVAVGSE